MTRLTIAYAASLFVLLMLANFGLYPSSLGDAFFAVPLVDKAAHFMMFGVLAMFVCASLIGWRRLSPARATLTGMTSVAIVATIEEVSNLFVPRRGWEWSDLGANFLGILCLGSVPLLIDRWQQWRKVTAERGAW